MQDDRRKRIRIALEAGPPLPLREARKRLLLLSLGAIAGTPHLLSIERDAAVCLISLADLVGLLAEPDSSLASDLGTELADNMNATVAGGPV
ncbi:hypothetical protein LAC81_26700 [Ensifer adhaerens]|uniref:hypothetical protein n=1 Tax=Ensifer adhaerens TaxID=106592 RepID=UPI001CBA9D9D|nr:hypothetical protein [Ensifer adhaerens]MBZ7924319.1 hypothetical protein [Ensifer adhaerens]UAX96431.1 hypothetical protein LAC78_21785 [Ensifer adhaerens]UAY04226.1 hypothetical protein LAC80_23175 [Ensifer adhaerens]UAY12212.1 hypothetical protein LAC81_26700 [Ensifer adhaerens]